MNPEQPTQEAAQPQRRRSSGFMPAFDSLQKQRSETQAAARRQSMSDQAHKGGIFSQFFHNNFGRNSK